MGRGSGLGARHEWPCGRLPCHRGAPSQHTAVRSPQGGSFSDPAVGVVAHTAGTLRLQHAGVALPAGAQSHHQTGPGSPLFGEQHQSHTSTRPGPLPGYVYMLFVDVFVFLLEGGVVP